MSSPTAAEREMAALVQTGTARRIVLPTRQAGKYGDVRRDGTGELLVLSGEYAELVRGSSGLDDATKEAFLSWLGRNPAAQSIPAVVEGLTSQRVDGLVRAGFLTAVNESAGRQTGVYARPSERYAMISLESVAKAAAGSLAAVGGEGAVHAAGGTGARSASSATLSGQSVVSPGGMSIAVPGSGSYLKLVTGALQHLADLLERTQYREMPESDLREKWDGGIADGEVAKAKKARGEFSGVLPGRTKKWKDFNGLAFGWILQEAVGVGLVEVFETRSVGRGVRLVG